MATGEAFGQRLASSTKEAVAFLGPGKSIMEVSQGVLEVCDPLIGVGHHLSWRTWLRWSRLRVGK